MAMTNTSADTLVDDQSATEHGRGETVQSPGYGQDGLTVRQVAVESGVSTSAIRFYEKHGLIEAARTSGNQRRFGPDTACRVRVARVAQRVGLTVSQIAAVLEQLPADPSRGDWQHLQTILVDETQRRITSLRNELDAITSGRQLCELDEVSDSRC